MTDAKKSSFIPNSVQTPHDYYDVIMPMIPPEEWVVLSYAIRHILGFHDRIVTRTRHISLSMFEHGYANYPGCGLGKSAIIKALEPLVKYQLLVPVGAPSSKGQEWHLNEFPDVEGLQERHAEKKNADKKRTQKARVISNGETENEESGLSHRPVEAVCRTDQKRSVPQTRGGLSHRHKEVLLSKEPREIGKNPTLQDLVKPEDPNAPTPGNIIKAWQDGIKSTSTVKAWTQYNIMIAQDMIEAGITPADVTAFFADLQWVNKTPGLPKVAEQIGGWKASQKPATPIDNTPRPMSEQERYTAHILEMEKIAREGQSL